MKHREKEAAQAIGFEAECDRHKAKLREIKRQQQEIVAPRQQGHETAAIAISTDADNETKSGTTHASRRRRSTAGPGRPAGGTEPPPGWAGIAVQIALAQAQGEAFYQLSGQTEIPGDPDRVTPGRGMRFMGGGKKKPVKAQALAGCGRPTPAN